MPDSSSRSIGSPFQIDQADWTAINKRTFLITIGPMGGEYARYQKLPSYVRLRQSCRTWKDLTFKRLLGFSRSLQQLTSSPIRPIFRDLPKLRSGGTVPTLTDFEGAIRALTKSFRDLHDFATLVEPAIRRFADDNAEADREFAALPDQDPSGLSPSPTRVLPAIQRVRGSWDAVTSDLLDLQTFIETSAEGGLELFLDLALPVVVAEWEQVEREAKAFFSNIDGQLRSLNGEDLYDDPVIESGARYRLTNQFLGSAKSLDTFSDTHALFMGDTGGFTGQFWSFTPLGFGWYRLSNQFLGEGKSLASDRAKPFIAETGNFSDQFWKLIPAGAKRYRLSNLRHGALRSLDTFSDTHQPFMGDTGNFSGQFWSLTRI